MPTQSKSVPCLKPRNWRVGTWLTTVVYRTFFLYFSHDDIRLLIFVSALYSLQLWLDSFHIRHKWSPACVAYNDLWPGPISSGSFSHNFAIKLQKYGTSCVRSTARTVLNGFFQYLTQMIIGMRQCVASNDLWTWPISWRSLGHDFAVKLPQIWRILMCPLYRIYYSG